MASSSNTIFRCPLCLEDKPLESGMPAELISGPIEAEIHKKVADWSLKDRVCLDCLEIIRSDYIQTLMREDRKEVLSLRQKVVKSLKRHTRQTRDLSSAFESDPTFAELMADKLAEFVGSWAFITLFIIFIIAWIVIHKASAQTPSDSTRHFNYLFLLLASLTAVQPAIILMGQNRLEQKERRRAESEHRVNLKAELEIRHINARLDQLLTTQWQRLLEIQHIQTDLMQQIAQKTISMPDN